MITLNYGSNLLWLGADKNEIEKVKLEKYTSEMIDNFFKQGRSTYAEGLASLYTYERQIPEIADVKIEGLKKFYGVDSESGLAFFETHKTLFYMVNLYYLQATVY